MNELEEYLSTAQVAAMYMVSERVVRNWCSTGRIQAVRSGGVWRIPREQFIAGPEEVRKLLETTKRINRRFEGW